ncbi:MAG: M28 family peptidase, partial [Limnochordia bacterium]
MENHKQNRNLALILLGFIVIMLVIAVCAIKPPKPVGSGAPQDQFASGRAMEHLAQIAAEPTPIGSVSHRQVWEYLLGELKALGLEAEIHETTMYNPYWRNAGNVANVIARIPGTDSSRAVALVAHYDTISLVPGASGSKAAIAAILEMLRVLSLREPLKNDLIILFADGGETGILGTLAFLEQHPWA